MVQKVNYYDILLKFCSERNIPVIEISEDEYYWGIIKYVILQIYDENIARLIYFKLTHDNISNMLLDGEDFEDPTKNILFLLSSMIGNPVALYYSNLTCCASTTQDLSDFVFEKNVEKYKPDIVPIIKDVDLLYHESTFLHELKDLAVYTGHTTAKEAGMIAKQANVKKLILGHFSNRYNDLSVFLNEACENFPETYLPEQLEAVKI